MALQRGDIDDLMGRIQDAGSRGSCAASATFLDGAPTMQTPSPARARRSRGGRRAALVLLLAALWSDVEHHERTAPSRPDAADPTRGAETAIAQDAAPDPGVEPSQAAAPLPPGRDAPQRPTRKPGRVAVAPEVSGEDTSLGGLDREIIQRYVRRNYGGIRHCYETRRLEDPTLAGTLDTHFVISPGGTVDDTTASGLDPEVATCVASVLQTIAFPSSNRPTEVNYPFHFVPVE